MHVKPVETRAQAAYVAGDGHQVALIDDLQGGMVVDLGVLERVAHESEIRARLAAGELSADILGLRVAAVRARIAPGNP